MQRSYHLNITASDQGSPSLLSSIAFLVTVEDDNDNAPAFPKVCPVYSALPFIALFFFLISFFLFVHSTAIVRQIQDGIPLNTPIVTVTVTVKDPDSGINSRIS